MTNSQGIYKASASSVPSKSHLTYHISVTRHDASEKQVECTEECCKVNSKDEAKVE